jgi:TonB family protein
MKVRHLLAVTSLLLAPSLCSVTYGQDPSHSSSATERKEEKKGAVDHMLEELANRNHPVMARCLENCEASASEQGRGGTIVNKVIPEYPAIARAAHATGTVEVKVIVDEEGKVIAAQAVSGHPLLQAASVGAARDTTFTPYLLNGQAVKITGIILYSYRM